MSRIPKTKSRPITVNNRSFRWMLKGKKRFSGNSAAVYQLTVQEDVEKPGGVLQITLTSRTVADGIEIDDNNPVHKATVYPSDVSVVIESAMKNGWDPASKEVFSKVSVKELQEYLVV